MEGQHGRAVCGRVITGSRPLRYRLRNLQDIWQVSENNSFYGHLWSFSIRSLRSRECGLYKASDLLLGDHLTEKSATVKWVDVCMPHKRRLSNDLTGAVTSPTGLVAFNVVEALPAARGTRGQDGHLLVTAKSSSTKCPWSPASTLPTCT